MVYVLFLLGFVFLVKGADFLVDGASILASRFGISNLVIGLTIVAFGTSAPELLVNVIASIEGASDIGVGNILGSNIVNIFLILGISALIYPLKVEESTTWKGIPLNLLAAAALFLLANDALLDGHHTSVISRIDGGILILFFIIFLYYSLSLAKHQSNGEPLGEKKTLSVVILMILLGILGLSYGGKWVVEGAIQMASAFGLSQSLIGLTIVAIGTSLPELATSTVAAYKKNTDIAIGNIVGSNLFNIFWITGLSAIIRPLSFSPLMNIDILIFFIATFLLFIFLFIGKKQHLSRVQGAFFVIAYLIYLIFLILRG